MNANARRSLPAALLLLLPLFLLIPARDVTARGIGGRSPRVSRAPQLDEESEENAD